MLGPHFLCLYFFLVLCLVLLSIILFIYLFFLVYDITKRATFLNLQRWIEEVRRYTGSNVLLVLVGAIFI